MSTCRPLDGPEALPVRQVFVVLDIGVVSSVISIPIMRLIALAIPIPNLKFQYRPVLFLAST